MAEVENGRVRHLQLKRNTEVFSSYAEAIEYINSPEFDSSILNDGELYLVRYFDESGNVATVVYTVYYDEASDTKKLTENVTADSIKHMSTIDVGDGLELEDGVVSVLLDTGTTQTVLGFNEDSGALQFKDIDCGEF